MSRLRIDQHGSAVIEFCFLSVLMLVPLVYLVAVLGRVQAAALAAQASAREAGRAFVTAHDDRAAQERAEAAALIAFGDHGFADRGTIEVICEAHPCLTPDARVDVRSRVVVLFPGVPPILDEVVPTRIEVDAHQVVAVDRFREPPAPSADGSKR